MTHKPRKLAVENQEADQFGLIPKIREQGAKRYFNFTSCNFSLDIQGDCIYAGKGLVSHFIYRYDAFEGTDFKLVYNDLNTTFKSLTYKGAAMGAVFAAYEHERVKVTKLGFGQYTRHVDQATRHDHHNALVEKYKSVRPRTVPVFDSYGAGWVTYFGAEKSKESLTYCQFFALASGAGYELDENGLPCKLGLTDLSGDSQIWNLRGESARAALRTLSEYLYTKTFATTKDTDYWYFFAAELMFQATSNTILKVSDYWINGTFLDLKLSFEITALAEHLSPAEWLEKVAYYKLLAKVNFDSERANQIIKDFCTKLDNEAE